MSNSDNQTQFSQTQPLYEQPVALPVDSAKLAAWQIKKRRILIVGGVALTLLASLSLLAFFMSIPSDAPQIVTTVQLSPTPEPDTSLRGRIQAAQRELQFIGQTEYQLPLPQVDWNIRLEDKKQ